MFVIDEIILNDVVADKISRDDDDIQIILTLIYQKGMLSREEYRKALEVAHGNQMLQAR